MTNSKPFIKPNRFIDNLKTVYDTIIIANDTHKYCCFRMQIFARVLATSSTFRFIPIIGFFFFSNCCNGCYNFQSACWRLNTFFFFYSLLSRVFSRLLQITLIYTFHFFRKVERNRLLYIQIYFFIYILKLYIFSNSGEKSLSISHVMKR